MPCAAQGWSGAPGGWARLLLLVAVLGGWGGVARGADPELVVREEELRSIDAVELFRNGLYWWTASSCSETPNPGGAAYVAYSDPRLISSTASRYSSLRGSSGGFKPGDIFDLGVSATDRTSSLRGVLLPDCGYGAHFVRDDEAFYYAKGRQLFRKPLNALSVTPGTPINEPVGIRLLPVLADGVLFATDQELWSYAADLGANTLTVNRTKKRGTTTVTEVVTLPGVSLRKFAIADIQDLNGSYFSSELILLTPDGRLYRSALSGNPQLIRTGVSDFAHRSETFLARGNLGLTVKRHATTLYLALGNSLTLQGESRLVGLDLTPGGRSEFLEHQAGAAFRVVSVAADRDRLYFTRAPVSNPANSDLLRRLAPAEPTLLNPGDPEYSVIATAREFRSLRSSGRYVYFAHGNTVQRLSANAPPIELDFEAFGIEVNQAVQNLNNTVPLAAGKQVVVRGYARLAANNTRLTGFGVPAQLRVYHAPRVGLGQSPFTEIAGSPFPPLEAPALTPVSSLESLRTNLSATYQFEVPPSSVMAGDLRFDFIVNPGRSVPETGLDPLANNTASATLVTHDTIPLGLTMVPMQFNGGFYDRNAVGSGFWDIIARARTQLPFANVRLGFRSPGVAKTVFTVGGLKGRSFDLPADENDAVAALDFARVLDGNKLGGPYVGMFPPQASPWNGLGRRPGQALIIRMASTAYSSAAWNSFHGGFNLAHEFGHNSGFRHIRNDLTCSTQIPGSSDGTYDILPNGASPCTMGATDLNDPATAMGFDTMSWSVVPPAVNGDLMSYANMVWISEYNWKRLLEAYSVRPSLGLAAVPRASKSFPETTVLLVQGMVHAKDNSATLLPGYALPSSAINPDALAELTEIPEGQLDVTGLRFQWLGDADSVLSEERVPARLLSEGDTALVSRALPLREGARVLRLVNGQAVLATLPVSGHAPTLRLDPPVLADGHLALSWAADDVDGDALHFTVQFSPDDGMTWQTLTVNDSETALRVDLDLLPGSSSARARVLATDGIKTTTAITDAFVVPRHAPEVRITGLADGQQFEFGTSPVAMGFGFDLEDGTLAPGALRWALTGPVAQQSTSETFPLSHLPPGTYSLNLSTIDGDGQTGAHTLQFSVRAVVLGEGAEPLLDGLSADPGYAGRPPVRFASANGLSSEARFVHADGALFVCLTGLRYGAANTPGAVAGLRVDAGGSGQAVATTVGFAVNENGEPIRLAGDGTQFVVQASPPPGLSVVILRDEHSWSAEMRIADDLLGGWNRRLGWVALFEDGNAATPPETWPPSADIDTPSSWATSQPNPPPPSDLMVNGSFENTQGTFTGDGFGLMSLPSGSTKIPGWTTTTAELAWVPNENAFGAATPSGTYSIELTGYHDAKPYGGVTQTISTRPGQTYRLSFLLGSNADYPGAGGQKSVYACAGGTGALFSYVPTNTSGNQWKSFSLPFVASSESTVISFGGLMASGNYLGLDDVSVFADNSPPSAPELLDLVVNGGFEITSCPGTFDPDGFGIMSLQPGATPIPGWTTTAAELAWGMNGNAFGPRSPNGELFLDLTGYHDTPPYGGVTQMLATAPNEHYRLTFSIGADQDRSSYRGPMSVLVAAGSITNSFTFTPAGTGSQWGTFTMDFVAASTATPLTITGAASAGGGYLGLDDVSVRLASSSPELRITLVAVSLHDLTIRFPTLAGREYVVEARIDLASGNWSSLPESGQFGTGAEVEAHLPIDSSAAARFFRVRQLP